MSFSFEKQLKNKLSQKTKAGIGEETLLARSFKFFDIMNKGCVAKNGFVKAIEKMGVIIEAEVINIFIDK
jgi:Ca2+-binding EF-hand superfamily protein